MSNEQKRAAKRRAENDDMALRLATARDSDSPGEGVVPVTANVTADEIVIEPEEERNEDLDAGV